jgi:hypothetical protein
MMRVRNNGSDCGGNSGEALADEAPLYSREAKINRSRAEDAELIKKISAISAKSRG